MVRHRSASCGAPHFRGSLTLPATFCDCSSTLASSSTRGVLNQHWYGRRRATDHALRLHSGFSAFQVCLSPEHLSPRCVCRGCRATSVALRLRSVRRPSFRHTLSLLYATDTFFKSSFSKNEVEKGCAGGEVKSEKASV